MSEWFQKQISLEAKSKGFHLITQEIVNQLEELSLYKVGLCNIFIQHTSASITINENADPTVRFDFESYFSRLVPENESYYLHTYEGSDDLPAHIKSSILGSSILIPIANGSFKFGTWQGIYLGEHRNDGGERKLLVTINGEK
tara:strand:- start:494 stop:922 length:429 start_codon:yes stop_codon:yes gene_type:complete